MHARGLTHYEIILWPKLHSFTTAQEELRSLLMRYRFVVFPSHNKCNGIAVWGCVASNVLTVHEGEGNIMPPETTSSCLTKIPAQQQ